MCIRPIKNKADLEASLQLLDLTWLAEEGSCDEERFQVLSVLVEDYERSHYPIDFPDPIEAIHYFMGYHDYEEESFVALVGSKIQAQQILLKQKSLTLSLIEKLCTEWRVPPSLLIKSYKLEENG